jgi:hypothetical protein
MTPKGRCAFCPAIAYHELQMQVDYRIVATLPLCDAHRRSLELQDWLLRLYGDGPTAETDARMWPVADG